MLPLRILFVRPPSLAQHGGIETYARELVEGIAGRGHAVATVESEPGLVFADLRWRDYWPASPVRKRYYLWRRFAFEDYRYHVALERRTRAAAAPFRPDVIHSMHVYNYGAIMRTRWPAIVTVNGLEVESTEVVRASLAKAAAVHAISEFTAGLVHQRIGTDRPVSVLSWGVKTIRVPENGDAEFDLVTISRLVRRKNVDTVLRALTDLPRVRYAVAGDGPELPALRRLASDLGIADRVTFFGAISDDERRRLLARARLFVMAPRIDPSDVEGLGLVYFEATGMGLPVIGASSGGAPEAIGDAGVLLDHPDRPAAVAGAIGTALAPARYAALLAAVRRRQQAVSWDAFLDAFEALYRGVSGRAPG